MTDGATLLLVAAGPRQHTPALQRAFDLAQRTRMAVHVLLLAWDPLIERSAGLVHPEVKRLAQQQFVDERRDWLARLAERWTADGLRVTTEVLWAPVAHEAILARALDLQPALVIKDVAHEPLLRRVLVTALDWRLLRYCPAPLLLVHEQSNRLPRRVLAAVDTAPAVPAPGPHNERILQVAAHHGSIAGAEVHVAHVFPYLPFEAPASRALENVYALARQADREAFDTFANRRQVPPSRRHWLEGNPALRLADLVRAQEIDLLVLGSAYRSALDRFVLGSTSEAVLERVSSDVLLVKPDGFALELAQHLDLAALGRRVALAAGEVGGGQSAAA